MINLYRSFTGPINIFMGRYWVSRLSPCFVLDRRFVQSCQKKDRNKNSFATEFLKLFDFQFCYFFKSQLKNMTFNLNKQVVKPSFCYGIKEMYLTFVFILSPLRKFFRFHMKSHVNREIAIYSFFLEHSYFLFSPKVNSQNLKRKGEKVKIKNFQYFKFKKRVSFLKFNFF